MNNQLQFAKESTYRNKIYGQWLTLGSQEELDLNADHHASSPTTHAPLHGGIVINPIPLEHNWLDVPNKP